MSILSDNLRYLRAQLGYSQQKVADGLTITRSRYSRYEDDDTQPPIELLIKMSRYFHVSIDLLVSVDLKKIPLKELIELPDNKILLPIKVDRSGEKKIEIITQKATMGYLTGYSDPEYIESLPTISLPFLAPGTYRAFTAIGDSMPPHKDSTIIIGHYLENNNNIKTGKTYIFVTRDEGITYKRLESIETAGLKVAPDNPLQEPYIISYTEILQIWQFACSITTQEFSKSDFELDTQTILSMFSEVKQELQNLKQNVHK
jgi:transcriptional regulator with XRE-family HTH domain